MDVDSNPPDIDDKDPDPPTLCKRKYNTRSTGTAPLFSKKISKRNSIY